MSSHPLNRFRNERLLFFSYVVYDPPLSKVKHARTVSRFRSDLPEVGCTCAIGLPAGEGTLMKDVGSIVGSFESLSLHRIQFAVG